MKNNPKSAIATTIFAVTLLASHSLIKDANSQTNSILCQKSGITEIKKGNITIYNSPECYISEDNTRFLAEVEKIKKSKRFEEVVVYPFYAKSSWNHNMIIKIDGSQSGTWGSEWYLYDQKSATLKNTNSLDLENAIAKIDSGLIK